MFYITEALLLSKNLAFSKHSGVIAAFGQHFIKSGIFDSKYHKMLLEAFKVRNIGDYGFTEEISASEVKTIVANAGEFLNATRAYLKK